MYWSQVRGASLEFGLAEALQTTVLNGSADVSHSRPTGSRILVVCPVRCTVGRQDGATHCYGARFEGLFEHVMNILMMAAEVVHVLMAKLGFRSVDDLIGHAKVVFGGTHMESGFCQS